MKLDAGQRLDVLSEQRIPEQPSTNLGIFNELLSQISNNIVLSSKLQSGDQVILQIRNFNDSWIVEQALTSAIQTAGCKVFIDSMNAQHAADSLSHLVKQVHIEIIPIKIQVRYDNMFREGMFGSKKVRRSISTEIAYQAVDEETRELRASGTLTKNMNDTVFVDAIPSLETPNVQSTHATLPDGSFLDRIFEPVVIVGAAGVAIYLFFHIRS